MVMWWLVGCDVWVHCTCCFSEGMSAGSHDVVRGRSDVRVRIGVSWGVFCGLVFALQVRQISQCIDGG